MIPFSQTILTWYSQHQRNLPWRSPHNTPYNVVVSEFMLQQTQVPRVIEKFKEFMQKFPTIQHLAQASPADVIHAWSGLGYNRRALLLHSFAQEVHTKYNNHIPNTIEQLQELPGMGPYTRGAVLSFAYNLPEPAIDVNIRRIYLRYFRGKDQGVPMGKKEEQELYHFIKTTIPEGKSCDLHNALMDFGSLICQRDKPLCQQCPLQSSCKFYPLYQEQPQKAFFIMEKRPEKGTTENGRFIPNRIFRGRIVEFVRKNNETEIFVETFGKAIKMDYTNKDQEWLLMLCKGLEKDKLLWFKKSNNHLSLHLSQKSPQS